MRERRSWDEAKERGGKIGASRREKAGRLVIGQPPGRERQASGRTGKLDQLPVIGFGFAVRLLFLALFGRELLGAAADLADVQFMHGGI